MRAHQPGFRMPARVELARVSPRRSAPPRRAASGGKTRARRSVPRGPASHGRGRPPPRAISAPRPWSSSSQTSPPPQSQQRLGLAARATISAARRTADRDAPDVARLARRRAGRRGPRARGRRCRGVASTVTSPPAPSRPSAARGAVGDRARHPLDPDQGWRPDHAPCAAPDTSKGEPSAGRSAASPRRVGQAPSTSVASASRHRLHLEGDLGQHAQRPPAARHQLHEIIAGDVLHHPPAVLDRRSRCRRRSAPRAG